MNMLRMMILGSALAMAAMAGCNSTAPRAGAGDSASTDRFVLNAQAGDIEITTTQRVSVQGLKSSRCVAVDPEDTGRSAIYQYEYSFMLVDGTVRLHRDGTLTLVTGELCVSSRMVRGGLVNGFCNCEDGSKQPMVLFLFPLVRSGSIQSGSVSTEYIVTLRGTGAPKVALRSGPGHKVWIARQNLGRSRAPDLILEGKAAVGVPMDLDGRETVVGEALDDQQRTRYAELDALARDMGVFKKS